MVGPVNYHTLRSKAFYDRRIQLALGIVKLEVEWRLVISNDEQKVRPPGIRLGGANKERYRNSEK